jgi:hypothetical protein
MRFLERRILAGKLSKAIYCLNVSNSKISTGQSTQETYRQQATEIIKNGINQLNTGKL